MPRSRNMNISYIDEDNGGKCKEAVFSNIERKRMIDILEAIQSALHDNNVEGYLPHIGTCPCGKGRMTCYDVRLKESVIGMIEIDKIIESLHPLNVDLVNVNANFDLRRFSLWICEIHGHDSTPR